MSDVTNGNNNNGQVFDPFKNLPPIPENILTESIKNNFSIFDGDFELDIEEDLEPSPVLLTDCAMVHKAYDHSMPSADYRFLKIDLILKGVISDCQIEAYLTHLGYSDKPRIQADFKARKIPIDNIKCDKNTSIAINVNFMGLPGNMSVDDYYWIVYVSFLQDGVRKYLRCYCDSNYITEPETGMLRAGYVTEVTSVQMQTEILYLEKIVQVFTVFGLLDDTSKEMIQRNLILRDLGNISFDENADLRKSIQTIGLLKSTKLS